MREYKNLIIACLQELFSISSRLFNFKHSLPIFIPSVRSKVHVSPNLTYCNTSYSREIRRTCLHYVRDNILNSRRSNSLLFSETGFRSEQAGAPNQSSNITTPACLLAALSHSHHAFRARLERAKPTFVRKTRSLKKDSDKVYCVLTSSTIGSLRRSFCTRLDLINSFASGVSARCLSYSIKCTAVCLVHSTSYWNNIQSICLALKFGMRLIWGGCCICQVGIKAFNLI